MAARSGRTSDRDPEASRRESLESHEMSKKQTEAVSGSRGLVTKHLKKGDRIRIGGLGILQCASAPPAWPQPATGEPIQIKASKKVLRAAKELKESV